MKTILRNRRCFLCYKIIVIQPFIANANPKAVGAGFFNKANIVARQPVIGSKCFPAKAIVFCQSFIGAQPQVAVCIFFNSHNIVARQPILGAYGLKQRNLLRYGMAACKHDGQI